MLSGVCNYFSLTRQGAPAVGVMPQGGSHEICVLKSHNLIPRTGRRSGWVCIITWTNISSHQANLPVKSTSVKTDTSKEWIWGPWNKTTQWIDLVNMLKFAIPCCLPIGKAHHLPPARRHRESNPMAYSSGVLDNWSLLTYCRWKPSLGTRWLW